MSVRYSATVLIVVCALAGATFAQTRIDPDRVPIGPGDGQPQFRGRTTLIPIDVRVLDKAGRPVTDLTASDFSILEDGVLQKVEHFALQRFEPAATSVGDPTRPSRAADAFETTSPNRRTFLILLGRGSLQEPSKGLDAMIHLVRDRALPQDYVGVMAWNRATDFTTDHDRIAGVLERFRKDHVGIEYAIRQWQRSLAAIYGDHRMPASLQKGIDVVFGGPRREGLRTMEIRDSQVELADRALRRLGAGMLGPAGGLDPVDQYMADQYNGDLDSALEEESQALDDKTSLFMAIEHLRLIAGQKQIMFVSEFGLGWKDVDAVRAVGRRASDARVVMNFIHAGGMRYGVGENAPPFWAYTSVGQDARMVSGLTGGQFFAHKFYNSSGDVDLMDQATRFQYTLGYYPARDPVDGRYRHVQVKVARRDVTVLARDGYYARAQVGPAEVRAAVGLSRVTSAAERPYAIPDIGLRDLHAAPAARRGELTISVTIDLGRVYFERKNDLNVATIDVAIFALTDRQRDAGQLWQTLNLTYSNARLAEMRRTGWHQDFAVPINANAADAKIVVYDYASDLLGSAVVKVERK